MLLVAFMSGDGNGEQCTKLRVLRVYTNTMLRPELFETHAVDAIADTLLSVESCWD